MVLIKTCSLSELMLKLLKLLLEPLIVAFQLGYLLHGCTILHITTLGQ